MANNAIVTGIFSVPQSIRKRVFTSTFLGSALSLAQSFFCTRGNFDVYLLDSSTPANNCNFSVTGGFSNNVNSTNSNFFFVIGTNVGCTITNATPSQLIVTTNNSSQIYTLTFSPYPSIQPTIVQTGGPAPSTTLLVQVVSYVLN
jgi:hypothetical protein